jgi:hypothetical protein
VLRRSSHKPEGDLRLSINPARTGIKRPLGWVLFLCA